MDIFQRIKAAKDRKEKTRILENFWLNEKRTNEENIEIIKKCKELLWNGNDSDKILALQVISRTRGFPLGSELKEIAKLFGNTNVREKHSIDEQVLLELKDKCLELLLNENGNVRIASAHCLDHIRSHLEAIDYIGLFYDLLSLLNHAEKQDKKKVKSIEFCLDKIWCPHLEKLIEANVPLAIKRMKITNEGRETKDTRSFENFANSLIKETEAYSKKLLALRGERLFMDNLAPYIANLGLFQVLYECQKIMSLVENNEIDEGLLTRYLNVRLRTLLNESLNSIEKIPDKGSWTCVAIDESNKDVKLENLQVIYEEFTNIKRDIDTNFLVNSLRQKNLKEGNKHAKR